MVANRTKEILALMPILLLSSAIFQMLQAKLERDAKGMAVAPGFINMMGHSENHLSRMEDHRVIYGRV
ncbi:MAG: hypothetical protein WDO19_23760 [Bacteroidota bacterium]